MFGIINTNTCQNVQNPLCKDPDYALGNPATCPPVPVLIVKPAVALTCALGSIQFSAFQVLNGAETDVTAQTTFSVSDLNVAVVAVVGAASGNATALTAGQTAINASYNGLTASAELTVLSGSNCCAQRSVAMLLLIDVTKSMGSAFGTPYKSRLAFAQYAAAAFANSVNGGKDQIAVYSFTDAGAVLVQGFTGQTGVAASAISTISQTNQTTGFSSALNTAITAVQATGADEQVIVVISDGEDEDPSEGAADDDPILISESFQSQGGIVMVLGCRASNTDNGFALLSQLATSGFFVNALPDAPQDAVNYFTGLMGYVCAGDCTPAGDVFQGKGALNFSAFNNWTVTGGNVDLFGNGFFDLLPNNGLYVNLAGTSTPHGGQMATKTLMSLTSGNQYRLTARMAGNQIDPADGQDVTLQVVGLDGLGNTVALLNQQVSITSYTSGFTDYAFTFTAPATQQVYLTVQEIDASPTVGTGIQPLVVTGGSGPEFLAVDPS